ncbi:MAG TPA: hypothetical protein VF411_10390 [Bacteroidia bacterium]
MKHILYILLFFLFGCADGKYKMYDMAYDKFISVDDLIESGEYSPEICNGTIDRIFKTKPPTINVALAGQLNSLLDKWATEEETFRIKKGDTLFYSHTSSEIIQETKYEYTYILSEKPMHVFSTCITVKILGKVDFEDVFIRVDNDGNIVGDYSDDSIVQNDCDKETRCTY